MRENNQILTTITSTRVRLARNIARYPFPQRLKKTQADEIIRRVGAELADIDEFTRYDMSKMSEGDAVLLQERHLISPALVRNKLFGAAFISTDTDEKKKIEKNLSVMVNEEDHLREQSIIRGFELGRAYEQISGVDEQLASALDFAYDEKFGFLTACPSNLGTGMRASVMMFLPALTHYKRIEELLPNLKAGGMTVRGVFGEGSTAEGYSYQVSNERTLGVSEGEILEQTSDVAMHVCELELRGREKMKKDEGIRLKDECFKAYGVLTSSALLTQKEFVDGMAKIKLGIALGYLKTNDMWDINRFIEDMRPASFVLQNCKKGATEEEINVARASVAHQVLPELAECVY
jgi:protein arginine kinase